MAIKFSDIQRNGGVLFDRNSQKFSGLNGFFYEEATTGVWACVYRQNGSRVEFTSTDLDALGLTIEDFLDKAERAITSQELVLLIDDIL